MHLWDLFDNHHVTTFKVILIIKTLFWWVVVTHLIVKLLNQPCDASAPFASGLLWIGLILMWTLLLWSMYFEGMVEFIAPIDVTRRLRWNPKHDHLSLLFLHIAIWSFKKPKMKWQIMEFFILAPWLFLIILCILQPIAMVSKRWINLFILLCEGKSIPTTKQLTSILFCKGSLWRTTYVTH